MSPFGYLPLPPADESDRQRTADILAREITPPPKDGQTTKHMCANEDCLHTSAGPARLCPVHAPNPPKRIGDHMPLQEI